VCVPVCGVDGAEGGLHHVEPGVHESPLLHGAGTRLRAHLHANPDYGIVVSVEGLYCKRPIQCLSSSEILIPHPPTARGECVPPAYGAGGGDTRWVERGVGGRSIFWKTPDTALYSIYVSTLRG
jgi:hypothetical protein